MEQNKHKMYSGEDGYDHFPISYEPIKCGTFHIYLFGQIVSPQQFISAIEVMRAASENDRVMIHLQSCGGSLDATDTFLQAMHECQAEIVVKASGGVHSAGTLILLAADSFMLSENFSSLIHNGSTGAYGKYSDYRAETAFTSKWMEKVIRNAYEGFLSDEEINDVLKGVDLWLDAEEWVERHEARNEYIQEKLAEFHAAQEADQAQLAAVEQAIASIEAAEKKPRKPRKKAEAQQA